MYYFAYGSNMNLEHMRRLCGWHFNVIGPAVLQDFEFGPDGRGYANIRQKGGFKVYGVLYDLDQYCLDILDDFEGCPQVFERKEVEVREGGDKSYMAWVYLEKPEKFSETEIKNDYLRRVIAGAVENHLPQEWITFLKSFERR